MRRSLVGGLPMGLCWIPLLPAIVMLAGSAACGQDPLVPARFREPATMFNGFSGDSRIRVRRFHIITLFDTIAHPQSAANDRQQLNLVFRSFNKDIKREGERNIRNLPAFAVAS